MEIKLLFCFVNTITRPILVTSRVFKIQPIWKALSGNKQHKISLTGFFFFVSKNFLQDQDLIPVLYLWQASWLRTVGEKALLFVCRLIFKTKNWLTRTGMKAAHRESEVRGAEVSQERKKEIKLSFFFEKHLFLYGRSLLIWTDDKITVLMLTHCVFSYC